MQAPDSHVDEVLRTAIENRRLIRLIYQGKERIIEPHDYGIQNGSAKLLAYQVAGSSSGMLPNWRWMRTELISKIHVLNQTFLGGRAIPSGKHHAWDKLFIRVKAADKDRIEISDFQANWDSAKLASAIAALGYPGFWQLIGGTKKDPAVVLLAALDADDVEVRVIEALPWLALRYYELDWDWLIAQVEQREAQNRLGFIVTLARRIAEKHGIDEASGRLRQVEDIVKRTRLVSEDTLCQSSLPDAERKWLRNSRAKDARYWNLLTDLDAKHLSYGA